MAFGPGPPRRAAGASLIFALQLLSQCSSLDPGNSTWVPPLYRTVLYRDAATDQLAQASISPPLKGRLPTRSNVEVRLLPPESGGGWGPQSLALDTTSGDYRRFLYYTSGGGIWRVPTNASSSSSSSGGLPELVVSGNVLIVVRGVNFKGTAGDASDLLSLSFNGSSCEADGPGSLVWINDSAVACLTAHPSLVSAATGEEGGRLLQPVVVSIRGRGVSKGMTGNSQVRVREGHRSPMVSGLAVVDRGFAPHALLLLPPQSRPSSSSSSLVKEQHLVFANPAARSIQAVTITRDGHVRRLTDQVVGVGRVTAMVLQDTNTTATNHSSSSGGGAVGGKRKLLIADADQQAVLAVSAAPVLRPPAAAEEGEGEGAAASPILSPDKASSMVMMETLAQGVVEPRGLALVSPAPAWATQCREPSSLAEVAASSSLLVIAEEHGRLSALPLLPPNSSCTPATGSSSSSSSPLLPLLRLPSSTRLSSLAHYPLPPATTYQAASPPPELPLAWTLASGAGLLLFSTANGPPSSSPTSTTARLSCASLSGGGLRALPLPPLLSREAVWPRSLVVDAATDSLLLADAGPVGVRVWRVRGLAKLMAGQGEEEKEAQATLLVPGQGAEQGGSRGSATLEVMAAVAESRARGEGPPLFLQVDASSSY